MCTGLYYFSRLGFTCVPDHAMQIRCMYRVGHEKVARVKANNMRSRTAGGGGGEMLTARLLTNCSITQRNIVTPERRSQVPEREYHKDTYKREAGYFFVAYPVFNNAL
jgi:hypothetical protein